MSERIRLNRNLGLRTMVLKTLSSVVINLLVQVPARLGPGRRRLTTERKLIELDFRYPMVVADAQKRIRT
jgi:hypothetical protein